MTTHISASTKYKVALWIESLDVKLKNKTKEDMTKKVKDEKQEAKK